ncbi:Uncharacterised protein at_DN0068 [Pycnogonum litorale]
MFRAVPLLLPGSFKLGFRAPPDGENVLPVIEKVRNTAACSRHYCNLYVTKNYIREIDLDTVAVTDSVQLDLTGLAPTPSGILMCTELHFVRAMLFFRLEFLLEKREKINIK